MNNQSVLFRFCAALLVLFAVSLAHAQVQGGIFTGTVTDPSGAAVPNATVTVLNVETGLSVTATTNSTGGFTTQQLPVGNYKLTVDAANFKKTTTQSIKLDVGSIQRADVKMQLGQQSETVEVTAEAPLVNTEDSKLQTTVGSTQIQNLPLNGRNVYDLIQLAPGASNVRGVLSENGAGTVVNGLREDFNGFLLNGVSNKGLSGGANSQPIEDTVQEFQLLTLNMSAQYGNSAGSVTNLVTKSGTNSFHGSAFEFVRNDLFDATSFFVKQQAKTDPTIKNPALHFNQFGGTIGGPIIKDKLFFYGAYQGDRFITSNLPAPIVIESQAWRDAVIAAQPNSVAALLYKNFKPSTSGTPSATLDDFTGGDYSFYLCDQNSSTAIVDKIGSIIGVTAADQANIAAYNAANGASCATPALRAGTADRSAAFLLDSINIAKTRTQNNLFQGNEANARIDWNPGSSNRLFLSFNWARTHDEFFPGPNSSRGFANPLKTTIPNGQFNFVHSFSPAVVNEFKAGYTGSATLINTSLPGVPSIYFDDGSLGFGSYSGYPQFFKENIYTYGDMVSISKGKHSIKIGGDVRRNIENSEFNVGRPSYEFFDQLFFAADAPYFEAAGTNPEIANGGTGANSHLQSNIRHWRNREYGAYFQDDWKVTRNLTLNLGVRYDLYQRHSELNNLATTFLPGPGKDLIDNITTGAGQIKGANTPAASCTAPNALQRSVLAGVCGPGGFAAAKSLGKGDHNNFGPRVGFAWDVFGNGKTSLRAGYGVSYEGTLYNPLSNSRWNPPYYSFNTADGPLDGGDGVIVYGPQSGGTPSYTGPADPLNHQGTGTTAVGNIQGWSSLNGNQAVLTGIIFPKGIRDPYVHNFFLGVQQEIAPRLSLELNYVGTAAHKLFRAQNVNRIPGSILPAGVCFTDEFGRNLCSQRDPVNNPSGRRLNPNYGRLRVWENVNNSNYNALQASLKKATSRGLTFNVNYTWSHSIDNGSTWHSGATSSNGAAAGEGYSTDQTLPGLDRSNAIFDIRHRLVANYVYELPWFKNPGPLNWFLGGWQMNGIVSYQSGAHWSPWCSTSACDLNKDGERNDRPNSDITNFTPSFNQWAGGWGGNFCFSKTGASAGCHFWNNSSTVANPGSLGRNTFVGPSFYGWDPSLFKNFRFTERVKMQFRWEVFNALNKTNFQLPGANGSTLNRVTSGSFGQAGGTFNPRQMQFGLKLSF